ncbi:MAG: nucleotide exchange factor GrpE [Myxococcales bacterium]
MSNPDQQQERTEAEGNERQAQPAEAPAPSPEQARIAKLEQELEAKGRRVDEVTRAYSALVNEQKEFRGRLEREKDRVLENERGNVALVLLETADELDRALAAASGDEGPLAQGVRLVRDGLMRRLQSMGIERVSLVGKPFDPNVAEAVDMVAVDDPAKADSVVDEAVPGYRLGNRLLRPARVRVARYVPPAQSQPAPEPPNPQN